MTKIPIKLISQGRISKKDYDLMYNYYDEQDKRLRFPDLIVGELKGRDVSFQKSTRYYKVLGRKKGEIIYRDPSKKMYEKEKVVEKKGTTGYNSYRIYIYSDIEDDAEAEKILTRLWGKTSFPANPKKAKLVTTVRNLDEDTLDEDTLMYVSYYDHNKKEYVYVDKWVIEVKESIVSFVSKIETKYDSHDSVSVSKLKTVKDRSVYGDIKRVYRFRED